MARERANVRRGHRRIHAYGPDGGQHLGCGVAIASESNGVQHARCGRIVGEPGRKPGGLSEEDRTLVLAVVGLREVRETIRAQGLEPPGLPPSLKWIDGPGALVGL